MTREEALDIILDMAERGAQDMGEYIYDGYAKDDGCEQEYREAILGFEEAKSVIGQVHGPTFVTPPPDSMGP